VARALRRRPLSPPAPAPAEAGPAHRSAGATAFFAAPVAVGLWVVAWVEALSALGLAGSRVAWAVFWGATAVLAAAGCAAVRKAVRARSIRMPRTAALAVPGAVLALTFVVALVAAPNNWDSMVYHNARVMQWWDHGSVAPWDTPIDRQVRMPPLASYFKLALLGLTGNDVLFNLVQWAFFAFSILAAAALASRLVPSGRAAPWAALLVATIPMAVLQSTSTQNDVVVAGYLLTAAFFFPRALAVGGAPFRDLALGGAAVGLGLATKGTAYLLAVPLLGAAAGAALGRIARRRGRERRAWAAGLGTAAVLVVLTNVGFWSRNARALGSPVGSAYEVVRPSAFLALGFRRAPALAVSQILRTAVLQLGQLRVAGVPGRVLVAATARVHRGLGIGVDEPAISGMLPFSSAEQQPINHEDAAPSTATFLVLVGATGVALARRSLPGRRAVLISFASGWAAWLLVALFVRWMPWNARLQLPALVLLAIPTAAVVAECLGRVPRTALASLLILQVLPALLLNWSRPLLSISRSPENPVWLQKLVPDSARRSIFATSRWEDYFRNRPALQAEVEDVMQAMSRRCGPGGVVQLVLDGDAWEYALWVGARRFAPGVHLRAGAPAPGVPAPCTVVRTRCPGTRAFCLDER
jgi:Dolichyl-phosphate-mannose-protein mannosyltransferase